MIELDKIYCIDCIEGLKKIDDNSIDMILCDLPYGITACQWDSIIPLDKLWKCYERITKGNGAIVLTASQPFTSMLIMSNPKLFREEIIWLKNKGGSGFHSKTKHIKMHETILVFSKKTNITFNPQKWIVDDDRFLTKRKTFDKFEMANNNIYGPKVRKRLPDDGTRNPISIVSYQVPVTPANNKKYSSDIDLRLHPTQKPLKLFEYLIKTYSNEGDLVLDNCMGSGTTAVACKQLNRHFIGFEISKEYCNIAKQRLNQGVLKAFE